MTSTVSFGDKNAAFQAGHIYGPVKNTFHTSPAQPETQPQPSVVSPFARDADFVDRGTLLDDICAKCARSNARIALVGLGGVGKSQVAIEHAYRTYEASPETWVLWAHASSAARMDQSFRDIADRVKIAGRQDPQANIFKLVHDWLCDSEARWLLVLDNVDDAGFLLEAQGAGSKAAGRPLRDYLPHRERGSILVTTRSEEAALKLVERRDVNKLGPMNDGQAQALLEKKLAMDVAHETQVDSRTVAELAAALENMPLAVVQAAAYIVQRASLCSVAQYLDWFKKSERNQTSLLNYDEYQLRRDREAKNSIITTWQISFEHIQQMRPSAADLLSLMSFFDRQGIPRSLLHTPAEHDDDRVNEEDEATASCDGGDGPECDLKDGAEDDYQVDSQSDSDDDLEDDAFQDDVAALRSFCLISVNTDSTGFEMHALVQLATRT